MIKAIKILSNIALLIMIIFLVYLYINKDGMFSRSSVEDSIVIGGNFALINQEGEKVTNRDFLNKYMLVLFGFSSCKNICPVELKMATSILNRLGNDASKLQVLFITIDSKRDTVNRLYEYHKDFDNRIIMLTGSNEQLTKIAKDYKVYVGNKNSDIIDHSSIMYLMGKKGEFLTHFSPDLSSSPEEQVNKFYAIIKKYVR